MKKIKFMLAAMILVAVVGGALAFNAKNFGGAYCTANHSGNCSFGALSKFDENRPLFWYTPTTNTLQCALGVQCTSLTSLGVE